MVADVDDEVPIDAAAAIPPSLTLDARESAGASFPPSVFDIDAPPDVLQLDVTMQSVPIQI